MRADTPFWKHLGKDTCIAKPGPGITRQAQQAAEDLLIRLAQSA